MLELLPFQIKGVQKIQKFSGRALIADEMGLGKTVQTIAWWIANPDSIPVVVVCPAFLKWHWEAEVKKHAGMRCDVLEGQRAPKIPPITKAPITIVNYDILPFWKKYIRNLNPQLIVIDEGQYIRAPDRQLGANQKKYSARTTAVRRICNNAPYVIALGGTGGLENRPIEMFALLNIIRPDLFPSYLEFAETYCQPRRKSWGWEYKGASNLNQLHKILKDNLMIRRTKAEVMPDLPKKTRTVIPMIDVGMKEYLEIERDFKKWLSMNVSQDKVVKGKVKSEALNKIGNILRHCSKMKMPSVLKWVDEFIKDSGEKIILFGYHRSVMKTIHEHYPKSVLIYGGTPKNERQRRVNRFNTNKNCLVCAAQLKAAGVGWSAKSCVNVGMVELWWNPATMLQAEDRVHGLYRGHEGKPAFIWYFVTRGTIEERLCRILQTKQGHIDTVLDGKKSSQFNILDQLVKELLS